MRLNKWERAASWATHSKGRWQGYFPQERPWEAPKRRIFGRGPTGLWSGSASLRNTNTLNRMLIHSGIAGKRGWATKAISLAQRNPFMTGLALFAGSALVGTGRQLARQVSFSQPERPSALRAGPGYISWSKSSGMPPGHLSTDGLSLALSNARHTSTIG